MGKLNKYTMKRGDCADGIEEQEDGENDEGVV
jgi:hypothetical protein